MQELLTALDISNKDFSRAFRGYKVEQVEEYLDTVANTVSVLTQSKRELERELRQARASLEKYEADKTKLQDTLLMAQKTATQYIEDSKQRAIEMKREAEEAAQREARQLSLQGQQLAEEIRQIKVIRDSFATSFRELLSKYNRALDFNYQRTSLDDAADTVVDYLEEIKNSNKGFLGDYMPQITEDLSEEVGIDPQTLIAQPQPEQLMEDGIEEYGSDETQIEDNEDLDYRY